MSLQAYQGSREILVSYPGSTGPHLDVEKLDLGLQTVSPFPFKTARLKNVLSIEILTG